MRLGVKVPNSGPTPSQWGLGSMAAHLEDEGFQSLWCSDHIVMPQEVPTSRYPFSEDGQLAWDLREPWYDAVASMALMAAATKKVEIGCAVLLLPMREPLTLAKQLATIDDQTGGRISLGVGAGWLREEFELVRADFDRRGALLDRGIEILRACWRGQSDALPGDVFNIPASFFSHPTPAHQIPIVVGGMTRMATRRAGHYGDGWLALNRADSVDADEIAAGISAMRSAALEAGRDGAKLRTTLRIVDSAGRAGHVAKSLPELAMAGVDEVVVDVEWGPSQTDAHRVYAILRDALG